MEAQGGDDIEGFVYENDYSSRDRIYLSSYQHGKSESLLDDIFTHGFLDIFIIFEGIVLLTLLFAIMNDTYDRVKINAKAELTRSRAAIVNDCEATFCKCLKNGIE